MAVIRDDEITEPGTAAAKERVITSAAAKLKTISSVELKAQREHEAAKLEIATAVEAEREAKREVARLTLAVRERDEQLRGKEAEIERLRDEVMRARARASELQHETTEQAQVIAGLRDENNRLKRRK
jgi:chromosome segregation ATPase